LEIYDGFNGFVCPGLFNENTEKKAATHPKKVLDVRCLMLGGEISVNVLRYAGRSFHRIATLYGVRMTVSFNKQSRKLRKLTVDN